ncbi:MAG: cyclic nucleotide-binding domain-containing protein [Deltaproteobacteria bacterium]|jgi:CRP-like cAMP-binding protein|nr:cyclic nucleotide-binding domain-containing protein [Deltaproteobacteria bacterium]
MKDTVEKMTFISSLGEAKVLAGLPEPTIFRLSSSSKIIKLEKGETIIREGEPAEKVIIIKSGLLNVSLQGFGNEQKIVRTCFPGDFLGENSVLYPPGSKLTTASLICATDATEIWQINAHNLINLMKQESILNQRINNIKELHQLDSFFSMHENMKDLDVNTRDELLSCIKTFIVATPGDVILDAGEVPENVFLVVKGEVEYRLPDDSKIVFGTDHFIGMRDALHGIAMEGEYVVTKESNLAMFDSDKLREMALASSTATVSILERLN